MDVIGSPQEQQQQQRADRGCSRDDRSGCLADHGPPAWSHWASPPCEHCSPWPPGPSRLEKWVGRPHGRLKSGQASAAPLAAWGRDATPCVGQNPAMNVQECSRSSLITTTSIMCSLGRDSTRDHTVMTVRSEPSLQGAGMHRARWSLWAFQ